MNLQLAETFVLDYDLIGINKAFYGLVVNKVRANVLVQFTCEGLPSDMKLHDGIVDWRSKSAWAIMNSIDLNVALQSEPKRLPKDCFTYVDGVMTLSVNYT